MRIRTSLYVLLALTLSVAGLGGSRNVAYAACQSPRFQSPAPASKAISNVLASAVERGDTPGLVALVVDRKGCVFEDSAGKLDMAQDALLTGDAIFRIASMTKPVTSVAIMILLEEGK